MTARLTCTECGAAATATAGGVVRSCSHDAPVAAMCAAAMSGAGDTAVTRRGPLDVLRAAVLAVAIKARARGEGAA